MTVNYAEYGVGPPPSGNSSSSSSGRNKYLGVPDNYTTTQYGGIDEFHQGDPRDPLLYRDNRTVLPRYDTGSEYDIYSLSVENLARLQAGMAAAGLISSTAKIHMGVADDTTLNAYKNLLEFSNRYGVDFQTGLGMLTDSAAATKKMLGAQPKQTSTSTSTSVNLTDPQTAHAILRKTITDELGRAPTASEYQSFLSQLNGEEKANPSVSTTTSTYDPNTGHTTSSTTSGGTTAPSPEVFADNLAHSGSLGVERNTKMAGVDYYNAAMAALGAGGGRLQ